MLEFGVFVPAKGSVLERCMPILVKHLVKVCAHSKVGIDTVEVMIGVLDAFFTAVNGDVPLNKLQLVGTTALLIAGKVSSSCSDDDNKLNPLRLMQSGGGAFSYEDLVRMEILILNTLRWSIVYKTASDTLGEMVHVMPQYSNPGIAVNAYTALLATFFTPWVRASHSKVTIASACLLCTGSKINPPKGVNVLEAALLARKLAKNVYRADTDVQMYARDHAAKIFAKSPSRMQSGTTTTVNR